MTKDTDQKTGQVKTCTKCGETKPVSEFGKRKKRGKPGLYARCKPCVNLANKKWREENPEKQREMRARHYQANPDVVKQRVKEWREIPENKERKNELERERRKDPKVRAANTEYNREWKSKPENREKLNRDKRDRRKNDPEYREKDLQYKKEYYSRPEVIEASKEKRKAYYSDPEVKERSNARRRERYATDPDFLCSVKCRGFIVRTARKAGTAKDQATHEILGYSAHDLRLRMEAQFRPGMSWDNYGEWHIDHKKPISAFLAQGVTDLRTINMLCNLQPLWAEENQQKSSIWPLVAANDNQKMEVSDASA